MTNRRTDEPTVSRGAGNRGHSRWGWCVTHAEHGRRQRHPRASAWLGWFCLSYEPALSYEQRRLARRWRMCGAAAKYPRWDLNPHLDDFKSSASADWATGANRRFAPRREATGYTDGMPNKSIRNPQFAPRREATGHTSGMPNKSIRNTVRPPRSSAHLPANCSNTVRPHSEGAYGRRSPGTTSSRRPDSSPVPSQVPGRWRPPASGAKRMPRTRHAGSREPTARRCRGAGRS
jgi:hypothetical protein